MPDDRDELIYNRRNRCTRMLAGGVLLMPVPLDEYPIHQAPVSMAQVATSDRNFYDRCYFNAHPRDDSLFLVTGLGIYPNLGVIDAYATVRMGERQWAVRFSDALGPDRLDQRVGPYRIEVLEPLHRLRVTCDADEHGLGFDLTWTGSFPAVQEGQHQLQGGHRTILDTARFAQVGTWSGELRVDGTAHAVDGWVGSRDRSWGIRPVGEPEPGGRPAAEPMAGFWWLYVPLRFDEFAVVVIAQERVDGFRTLNDAVRVWPDGRVEQLGWPQVKIAYRPGSRHPRIRGSDRHGAGRHAAWSSRSRRSPRCRSTSAPGTPATRTGGTASGAARGSPRAPSTT